MKWKNIVEDYFTFNKPQRRSIIIALSLIFACLLLRFSYSYFFTEKTVAANETFLQEAARLTRPDTTQKSYTSNYRSRYSNDDNEAAYREPYQKSSSGSFKPKGELFPFDPNTLDAAGWKRLGVRDKTIGTIQNYLSKGGRFRQPEDIQRIYGLFPDEAERLLPYVKIAPVAASEKTFARSETGNTVEKPFYKPAPLAIIDVNTADTTAFIALPGIGNKLANRIVNFRNRLGGFHSVDQVAETFGLPDSVFARIKPRLTIANNATTRLLNINTASADELKANPYIRWNIANAIVQYRQQHGNYTSLDDLKKIVLIDEQLLAKIRLYLTIQ